MSFFFKKSKAAHSANNNSSNGSKIRSPNLKRLEPHVAPNAHLNPTVTPHVNNAAHMTASPWSKLTVRGNANVLPRYGHSSHPVAEGGQDIYIFGGMAGKNGEKNDFWVLNVNTSQFNALRSLGEVPSPRLGHASVLIGNAFIVFGGFVRNASMERQDNALYLLNTTSLVWQRALASGARPSARYGHTLNTLGTKICIFGGQLRNYFFNDLIFFDLDNLNTPDSRWELVTAVNDSPPARANHIAVSFAEKLYVFGGTNGVQCFNDLWCFHPKQSAWSRVEAFGVYPTPREGHSAAVVNDVLYVFGGRTHEGAFLNDLMAFKFSTKQWYKVSELPFTPSPRANHTLCAAGAHVVLIGGQSDRDVEDVNIYMLDTTRLRFGNINATPAARGYNLRMSSIPQFSKAPSRGIPGNYMHPQGRLGPKPQSASRFASAFGASNPATTRYPATTSSAQLKRPVSGTSSRLVPRALSTALPAGNYENQPPNSIRNNQVDLAKTFDGSQEASEPTSPVMSSDTASTPSPNHTTQSGSPPRSAHTRRVPTTSNANAGNVPLRDFSAELETPQEAFMTAISSQPDDDNDASLETNMPRMNGRQVAEVNEHGASAMPSKYGTEAAPSDERARNNAQLMNWFRSKLSLLKEETDSRFAALTKQLEAAQAERDAALKEAAVIKAVRAIHGDEVDDDATTELQASSISSEKVAHVMQENVKLQESLSLLKENSEELNQQLSDMNVKNRTLVEKVESLEKQLEVEKGVRQTSSLQIIDANMHLRRTEALVRELEDQLVEQTTETNKIASERQLFEERCTILESTIKELLEKLAASDTLTTSLHETVANLNDDNAHLIEEVATLKAELTKKQSLLDSNANLVQQLEASRNLYEENVKAINENLTTSIEKLLDNRNSTANVEIEALNEQLRLNKIKLENNLRLVSVSKSIEDALRLKIQQANDRISMLESTSTQAKTENNKLQIQLMKALEQRNDGAKQLISLRVQLSTATSELDLLKLKLEALNLALKERPISDDLQGLAKANFSGISELMKQVVHLTNLFDAANKRLEETKQKLNTLEPGTLTRSRSRDGRTSASSYASSIHSYNSHVESKNPELEAAANSLAEASELFLKLNNDLAPLNMRLKTLLSQPQPAEDMSSRLKTFLAFSKVASSITQEQT
ncbi:cell end marker Tea1 [Schizosaccharomyces japonicus yFS275]|uniref:Cell end marker Tea1 n=1 Tax=Schizosaccharomyces japonicus (strain yFS275 / FY16936) TaxID=402676 RepID=B6K007_SCHJY|nr:cell end marker Tea1 [Schizosaccharomyces japonicus yFS275]EEB06157.1 cell end marker Tea1 [Schizosaccharomyces japonicus yFS275]